MLSTKRNPVIDLVKAAVGLSTGSNCTCGSAKNSERGGQTEAPGQASEAGTCGCSDRQAPALAEHRAGGCGCGR